MFDSLDQQQNASVGDTALQHVTNLSNILVLHSHECWRRELSRFERLPSAPSVTYGASYQDAITMLKGATEVPSIIFCQFKNLAGASGAHVYEYVRSNKEKFGDVPFVFMSADDGVLKFAERLREKDPNAFAISVGSLSYQEQLAAITQEIGGLQKYNLTQIKRELFNLRPTKQPAMKYEKPEATTPMERELGYQNVLIVEDEPHIARLTEVNLRRRLGEAATITRFSNGADAVNFFKDAEQKPDLILMDSVMPYMNGEDAVRAIRLCERDKNSRLKALDLPTEIPVQFLFITASPELFEKTAAEEAGLIVVLEKPWSPEQLDSALESLEPMAKAPSRLSEYVSRLSQKEIAEHSSLVFDLLTSSVTYTIGEGVHHKFHAFEAPPMVGRPLRFDELSHMYAAILNRDAQFIERDHDYSLTQQTIFQELYKNPAKADFVFHAAFQARSICNKYSVDRIIIPGIERSWAQIQNAGLADALIYGDSKQADRDVIAIMQSAFDEAPKGPNVSIEYPQLGHTSQTAQAQLFGAMILTAMHAVAAQTKDPQPMSSDDFQIVLEYTLNRLGQRQYDAMTGTQDSQVQLTDFAKNARKKGQELQTIIDRLVA